MSPASVGNPLLGPPPMAPTFGPPALVGNGWSRPLAEAPRVQGPEAVQSRRGPDAPISARRQTTHHLAV
eukprot:9347840-Alexandrium_andersonii.AAC.1